MALLLGLARLNFVTSSSLEMTSVQGMQVSLTPVYIHIHCYYL